MPMIHIPHLPPPAQAQAQPAQAHAQAQLWPPPPLQLLPERVATGTGFVLLVMVLVKSVTFPITPPAKFWTPPAIEAAKVLPGRLGIEKLPPPLPEEDGAEAGRTDPPLCPNVGS